MSWWESQKTKDARKLDEELLVLQAQVEEKLNPAQPTISDEQGSEAQTSSRHANAHQRSYNCLEVVNRGVNLIADCVSEFKIDVKDRVAENFKPINPGMRQKKLITLLNFKTNQYISAEEFKRSITVDLLLEGNAFIYYDGNELYVLPAINVEIITDKKEFIKAYKYDNTTFVPKEIIHIRDNSSSSIFRGSSRLDSAVQSISILNNMNSYQNNFFKNNTILGIVLSTDDILSKKIKQRKILEWIRDYNPTSGGRKPLILDGGFKIEELSKYNFKELDFAESIVTQERKILEALGVPPILLDSGNNANISPNLKLFYTTTILPIVKKIVAAFELYFGYDLKEVTADIIALKPELREEAQYYATLVNAGIITRNEARQKLRWEEYTEDPEVADRLILPANIAGSAVDASTGGRPVSNTEE